MKSKLLIALSLIGITALLVIATRGGGVPKNLRASGMARENASPNTSFYGARLFLPEGWKYEATPGIDSLCGNITNGKGDVIARYDIGRMAGLAVTEKRRKDYLWFGSEKFNGLTMAFAYTSRSKDLEERLVVTFPALLPVPPGPANFFASRGITKAEEIMLLNSLRTMEIPINGAGSLEGR
jgi:ABC-type amino acid transport substrate-binding protein